MSNLSTEATNLNWLLARFVDQVPGAVEAIVVSSDGLLMAMSENLARAAADRFAAVASGLMGLAYGAAGPFGGGNVNEVIVEMDNACLFVTSISDGSRFAVVTEMPCDVGLLGYEMAVFVERAGAMLTPALVSELRAALPS